MEKSTDGNRYIPTPGDIIRIDITELTTRKRGYVLTISPYDYNVRMGLCLVCPVVFKEPANALEIPLLDLKEKAVILADQVRSIDYYIRKASFVTRITMEVLDNVKKIIRLLVN